jgi:hypothetical protein
MPIEDGEWRSIVPPEAQGLFLAGPGEKPAVEKGLGTVDPLLMPFEDSEAIPQ